MSFVANNPINDNMPAAEAENAALNRRRLKGDASASSELFQRNMGLAYFFARSSKAYGLPWDEAVSAGLIALHEAIERFDHRQGRLPYLVGMRFSLHADAWRSVFAKSVRLPRHALRHLHVLNSLRAQHLSEHGNEPTDDWLVQRSRLTAKQVASWRQFCGKTEEIDIQDPEVHSVAALAAEVASACSDPYAEAYRQKEISDLLEPMIAELSQTEQQVLRERFGLNRTSRSYTLDELGLKFKRTRERIRQIEESALKNLRMRLSRRMEIRVGKAMRDESRFGRAAEARSLLAG